MYVWLLDISDNGHIGVAPYFDSESLVYVFGGDATDCLSLPTHASSNLHHTNFTIFYTHSTLFQANSNISFINPNASHTIPNLSYAYSNVSHNSSNVSYNSSNVSYGSSNVSHAISIVCYHLIITSLRKIIYSSNIPNHSSHTHHPIHLNKNIISSLPHQSNTPLTLSNNKPNTTHHPTIPSSTLLSL